MSRSHVVQYLDEESRVQIPMEFLTQIGVGEGDDVELSCQDSSIMISKASSSQDLPEPSSGQ